MTQAKELIDEQALNNAVENLVNDKDIQNDVFRKNYDPHTKLVEIAEIIDTADLQSDKIALSIGSFGFITSIFVLLETMFESSIISALFPIPYIVALIVVIFNLVNSGRKHSKATKELTGHTFSYLDKQQLQLLLEERGKKFNFAIMGSIISIIIGGIITGVVTTVLPWLEIFAAPFLLMIIGAGMYFYTRTANRKTHVKKAIDKSVY